MNSRMSIPTVNELIPTLVNNRLTLREKLTIVKITRKFKKQHDHLLRKSKGDLPDEFSGKQ